MLPAGPWRQPWNGGAGHVLVLTAKRESDTGPARAMLARAYRGRPIAEAVLAVGGWGALGSHAALADADPAGRVLLPVCGIADPEPFIAHARAVGEVPRVCVFRDHAAFGPGRVRRLVRAAESARVDYVVTTAKDAVKLGPVWPAHAPPVLVAQLAVRWVAGESDVTRFLDAPITTVTKAVTPAGFKVVRVDTKMQEIYDFAVNKMTGPASKLPHVGFERPSHCQFGPDGALYIADFGIIHIAPERGGIRQQIGTGALWRICRVSKASGITPPPPTQVPLYLLQGVAILAGMIGVGFLTAWLIKRIRGRNR